MPSKTGSEKERISGKVRSIFESCQDESHSVSKSVVKFRNLWDETSKGDPTCPNADYFFDRYAEHPMTSSI